MEQQRNETRQALRRAEQAHAETQQALDQTTRQAQIDGIRQSQLSRDLTEAQAEVEATQAALSETSGVACRGTHGAGRPGRDARQRASGGAG